MESRSFLDGLNVGEIAVEYAVRGFKGSDDSAEHSNLNKILIEEQSNKQVRPTKSHVKSNPEMEIENCRMKAQELKKFSEGLGSSPAVLEGWLTLTKAKHYKDRAERVFSSFGNVANIGVIVSELKNIIDWHAKILSDFHEECKAKVAARVEEEKRREDQGFDPAANSSYKELEMELKRSLSIGKNDRGDLTSTATGIAQNFNSLGNTMGGTIPASTGNQQLSNHIPSQLPNIRHSSGQSNFSVNLGSSFLDGMQNVGSQNVVGQVLGGNSNHVQFEERSGCRASQNNPNSQGHINRRYLPENDFKVRQRWNISYDGKVGKNVRDFVYRLETMAAGDNYPVENLTRMLHLFLEGKANDWFWICKQTHPVITWDEMKRSLISYFDSFDSEEETKEEIIRRTQGPREYFSDFCLEIQKLNGRLVNRFSEREIIKRLFHNMHPALRNMVLAHQSQMNTIDDLRVLCTRYEKHWFDSGFDPRKNYDTQYRRRAYVNECYYDLSGSALELNQGASNNLVALENKVNSIPTTSGQFATSQSQYQLAQACHALMNPIPISESPNDSNLSSQVKNLELKMGEISSMLQNLMREKGDATGNLVCWNCMDIGHPYQDCPKEMLHIFCFGCGAPNVRKPNCLKCEKKKLPGNVWTGVNSRGPRSSTNLVSNPRTDQSNNPSNL